jgi:hypothetical protein
LVDSEHPLRPVQAGKTTATAGHGMQQKAHILHEYKVINKFNVFAVFFVLYTNKRNNNFNFANIVVMIAGAY